MICRPLPAPTSPARLCEAFRVTGAWWGGQPSLTKQADRVPVPLRCQRPAPRPEPLIQAPTPPGFVMGHAEGPTWKPKTAVEQGQTELLRLCSPSPGHMDQLEIVPVTLPGAPVL